MLSPLVRTINFNQFETKNATQGFMPLHTLVTDDDSSPTQKESNLIETNHLNSPKKSPMKSPMNGRKILLNNENQPHSVELKLP